MPTHFIRFIYFWTGVCLTTVFGDNLLMVQVLWRHGDRSPTKTFANDPNQESAWPLGFGQLTPQGMEQHMILGDLLYNEYVIKQQFLNTSLSFNQMYVRSTDVNRTYISAYSNLFGMYYNRTQSIPGTNFPENSRWPGIMVPFPVHSVTDYDHDYVGNPLSHCPRREWLWSKAKEAPELVKLQQEIESLLSRLKVVTGDEIDIDNLWYVRDAIFIEKLHQKPVIINDTLFDEINAVVDLLENYEDGIDLTPTHGIDFSIEIPKVRGGSTLWSVINNFDLKLHCLDPINQPQSRCQWMKNMKYYAYSVHDNTISALMATMGAKKKLVPYGYPAYSSCFSLELWDTPSGPAIRALYHPNHTTGFDVVTNAIRGCENITPEKCRYSIVRENANAFYPGNHQSALCEDTSSPSTDMWNAQTTTNVESTGRTDGSTRTPTAFPTTSKASKLQALLSSLPFIAMALKRI